MRTSFVLSLQRPDVANAQANREAIETSEWNFAKEARVLAPHPCIRGIDGILTMMQQCASARSSGAAGPIFITAFEPCVDAGAATSDRHRQSTVYLAGVRKSTRPRSSCTDRDSFRDLTSCRHAPQRDEKLSRQCNDHGLSRGAARILGDPAIPFCKGAFFLE